VIESFGFRGEALASIAAVADVECASGGATLRIRNAEVVEQGAGPLLPGVAIEVRDLFGNVPARLKFLKSDATEMPATNDVVGARSLVFALEECYQGRLERGRHPIAIIDIGIDPELVDVNVHPAKKEVRFRDEGAVFAALQRAVRSALDGSDPFRYRPSEIAPAAVVGVAGPQLTLHDAPAAVAAAATNGHATAAVLRPIGQAGPGYLVAEGPHALVLVDQHAAHERVLYNRLLDRLRNGRGASQPLLIPQAVDVDPGLIAAAADHRAELANLGLEYEEFGPRSLRITAVPTELPSGRATAA